MKNSNLTLKFGVLISLCLIASFLLFALLQLHTNPIFSLINGVIMATGMFYFLKRYKKREKQHFNYEKGFTSTLLTGVNATTIFTVFFALYSDFIEPNYIATMLGHWSKHYHTPQVLVVFIVFAMGLVSSLLLSLTYMQYFKDSWNTTKPENNLEIQAL